MNYYNENDPKTAAWLRQLIKDKLISDGIVDDRSIMEVKPDDLKGFIQCHFFAGIGGWSYALRLAGWPDERPVWTGSCPCQPYSAAGKRKGNADERNLWPIFFKLIAACKPECVFGEQVAAAIGHEWLDGICTDLESENYTTGAAVLGAHSVCAPHTRQRLYWMAYTRYEQWGGRAFTDETFFTKTANSSGMGNADEKGLYGDYDHKKPSQRISSMPTQPNSYSMWLGNADGSGIEQGDTEIETGIDNQTMSRLGNAEGDGRNARRAEPERLLCSLRTNWGDTKPILCGDGKTRRIKPGLAPLAHGISERVVRLRGYGNAIVPQLAAEFIKASQEAIADYEASQ